MLKRTAWMLLLCCLTLPSQALVNAQPPAEDDTRFDAVGAWGHTAKLNPGQGNRNEHQWYGAAVLIAPDVVLTAKHLLVGGTENLPAPGAMTVRFRRHEDGSIGSIEAGPASFHQATVARYILCPNADLMLCILTEPVEHIEPVTVDLDGEAFRDEPILLAAWGSESHWQGDGNPRTQLTFGEHTASSRGGYVQVASFDTEQREKPNGQPGNWITDEHTVPNMYDSGGSMFVEDEEGELKLVAIIMTYTAGTGLARFADDPAFPLRAAVAGGDALLDAVGGE